MWGVWHVNFSTSATEQRTTIALTSRHAYADPSQSYNAHWKTLFYTQLERRPNCTTKSCHVKLPTSTSTRKLRWSRNGLCVADCIRQIDARCVYSVLQDYATEVDCAYTGWSGRGLYEPGTVGVFVIVAGVGRRREFAVAAGQYARLQARRTCTTCIRHTFYRHSCSYWPESRSNKPNGWCPARYTMTGQIRSFASKHSMSRAMDFQSRHWALTISTIIIICLPSVPRFPRDESINTKPSRNDELVRVRNVCMYIRTSRCLTYDDLGYSWRRGPTDW